MAKLLNGVTSDTTGTRQKVVGPTTVVVESSSFGGGTVTIYFAKNSTSRLVSIGTFTAEGAQNINYQGVGYLSATLSGSTSPSALTVETLTNGQ